MKTKPFNAELFLKNLNTAIAYQRSLESDPYDIQNAVVASLTEVKDALDFAIKDRTMKVKNG